VRGIRASRGWQITGGGRGGHRGSYGNGEHPGLGSGSNFVQGESSNAGGMNNANQNWAGNHQRSFGYTSGPNPGYGGH
jgi:hypothetical protein